MAGEQEGRWDSFALVSCSEQIESSEQVESSAQVESSEQVESDEAEQVAVSVELASAEDLADAGGRVHFYDTDSINTEWKLLVSVDSPLSKLCFIEINESEGPEIGKSLFEAPSASVGDSFVFHTYINDTTLNRGISYTCEDGRVKYYGIAVSMKDGSLYLKELAI